MYGCKGTNPQHNIHSLHTCENCGNRDHKYLQHYVGCDICQDEKTKECVFVESKDLILDSIYVDALNAFGQDSQMDLFIEESLELSKAILKARRYIKQHDVELNTAIIEEIKHEIVDVVIMVEQMKAIFFERDINKRHREFNQLKEQKLDRLKILIKEQRGRL